MLLFIMPCCRWRRSGLLIGNLACLAAYGTNSEMFPANKSTNIYEGARLTSLGRLRETQTIVSIITTTTTTNTTTSTTTATTLLQLRNRSQSDKAPRQGGGMNTRRGVTLNIAPKYPTNGSLFPSSTTRDTVS